MQCVNASSLQGHYLLIIMMSTIKEIGNLPKKVVQQLPANLCREGVKQGGWRKREGIRGGVGECEGGVCFQDKTAKCSIYFLFLQYFHHI